MAITQEQIDALDAAILSGEHSVSFNGRTVTYRTVGDLIKARDHAVSLLAAQAGNKPRTFHFNFKTARGD